MANLVFYYGAMGCSKTANALMTRFQYIDKGLHVWLVKPATDNRDDIVYEDGHTESITKSRVGIYATADVIKAGESFLERYKLRLCDGKFTNLIIVDEAQFLTEDQIDELKDIAETLDIPVYCYGLRTDFRTKLFPGSKRLFEICSKTVELESICECGKPAIINARFNKDGHIMTHGAQVDIGGDEKYKALCYSCWKELSKEDV
jgi:thymidine kinase